ncbi:HEPN domain-containing protein [Cellulosilyticum lentocellum]|uniref:Uncharacterized protein n=1 Tax=Cellulosilyticum lentocellum (strain ATCC 49066 / DSM 5427 / NCIMB 11756 / RHM5) TaxID=642492 RepID=F2JIF6_CELLD|nr:HEPN domain-containing protein [Cellulosilyticum lentocellum]ADZ84322.1 hypothetical protein Clole_2621 [Cellulosilyticum lentocellum DSM 5427]
MLIIPIQGIRIRYKGIIRIIVRAYTAKQMATILGIDINTTNGNDKEMYLEKIDFADKSKLKLAIDLRGEDNKEADRVITKYRDCNTFALLDVHTNRYVDIFDLKVAISILYIANRWTEENTKSFFKQVMLIDAYHTNGGCRRTECAIKIGDRAFDENDFELTIPKYYTSIEDNYNSIVSPLSYLEDMSINENISDTVEKLFLRIILHDKVANSIRSALNLLYSNLTYTNLDTVIPTYATILETLLLGKNESNQRKKVAIRSACLIADSANIEKKRYIANWVYYFYELRNKIVHDGVSHVELRIEYGVIFEHTISFISHLVYNLIKLFVEEEISSLNSVKRIVKKNIKQDKLDNGFEYINENRIMYYEE